MRPTSLLTLSLLTRAVSNSAAIRPRFPPPAVMVHGGAGSIEKWEFEGLYNGTRKAVRAAFEVVKMGGPAYDAVVEAIKVMEDDPSFNAGRGAALTMTGHVEHDASLMYGTSNVPAAGTVASITGIKNPILAAKLVMMSTPHVQLAGSKASEWLANQGLDIENEVCPHRINKLMSMCYRTY